MFLAIDVLVNVGFVVLVEAIKQIGLLDGAEMVLEDLVKVLPVILVVVKNIAKEQPLICILFL